MKSIYIFANAFLALFICTAALSAENTTIIINTHPELQKLADNSNISNSTTEATIETPAANAVTSNTTNIQSETANAPTTNTAETANAASDQSSTHLHHHHPKNDSSLSMSLHKATTTSQKILKKTSEKFHHVLDTVTPSQPSVLEERIKQEDLADKSSFSLTLYRPTYLLPYYYTGSPDYAVYDGQTPNGQKIMRNEFKGQISLMVPIWKNMYGNPDWSFMGAYTQLNYWQVYASSQYFRETNYEPEVFFENHFHQNWLARFGINHQSNGRGGDLERSWNRAIGSVQLSGDQWLVSLKVWALIFEHESSDLHNPDIAKYLGYDNLRFSYRFQKTVVSVEFQNLESAMRRGFVQATVSYPLFQHMSIYAQYFNGYGQSLIEYNHRTQSAGVGIAFNDWI